MNLMRGLFEQVRVTGKVIMSEERFMRDRLPVVYTCEDPGGCPYYSSGGRSVIVQKDEFFFKINGVDPYGHLTRRVAQSAQNRLEDVRVAHKEFEEQGPVERKTFREKPFGVYTRENVEKAGEAFSRLNRVYLSHGLTSPCEFVASKQLDINGGNFYQMLFELPSIESDLRVNEFMNILEQKLSQANREELQEKFATVKRIFGRFIAWTGYAMGIMVSNGLVPVKSSWAPQNYVLHKVGSGYGAFRVDHSSTAHDDAVSIEEFSGWVEKGVRWQDSYFPTIQFSFVPEAAEIAARYPEVAKKLPYDGSPFVKVLEYYKSDNGKPKPSLMDMSLVFDSYQKVFVMGLACAARKFPAASMAIPEEYLIKVLE